MKALINFPPMSFDVEVTLYTQMPEGVIIHNLDGSERERLTPGEQMTPLPTAVLASEVLRAIVAEIVVEPAEPAANLPPSSAAERHLSDVIGVRDRLLDAYLPQREPS